MTIDTEAFRATMGQFATGVTVITTRMRDGRDLGITANSFTSVSLEPPLVLWSLDRASDRSAGFGDADSYVVNVLAADQVELSKRFSGLEAHDFDGLKIDRWETGCPVLPDSLASIECTMEARHDGGDHVICVGRVVRLVCHREGDPLVFFNGAYCNVEPASAG